jgi:hypothetical protein
MRSEVMNVPNTNTPSSHSNNGSPPVVVWKRGVTEHVPAEVVSQLRELSRDLGEVRVVIARIEANQATISVNSQNISRLDDRMRLVETASERSRGASDVTGKGGAWIAAVCGGVDRRPVLAVYDRTSRTVTVPAGQNLLLCAMREVRGPSVLIHFVRGLCTIVLLIGVGVQLAYVTGSMPWLLRWGNTASSMALSTAICLTCVSVAIFVLTFIAVRIR